MIETLKKEIKFQKYYIKTLRKLKKQKRMRVSTADSRIATAQIKIKELREELKTLEVGEHREQEMKILRRLAKKLKYDSVIELENDLKELRSQ